MLATTNWATFGATASAVFAAVAALASWAAVRQTRRQWSEDRRPRIFLTTSAGSDAPLASHIRNGGGGTANEIKLMFVEDDEVIFTGLPPTGMLGPDEGVSLELPWRRGSNWKEPFYGLVVYRGTGNLYARTTGGREKRWGARALKRNPRSVEEIFREFFPEMPDPANLRATTFTRWFRP